MSLEPNFDFIDELNPLNPADNDPVEEGDDHLRGIKNALKGNVTGDATQTRLLVAGAVAFRQQNRGWDSITPTGNALSRLINESDGFVQLDLQNQVAGGWQLSSAGGSPSLLIQQLTAGGAFAGISASFVRNGEARLNYDSNLAIATQEAGGYAQGSDVLTSLWQLRRPTDGIVLEMNAFTSGNAELRNRFDGGQIRLSVNNAGVEGEIGFQYTPGAASQMNHAGGLAFVSTNNGGEVRGQTAAQGEFRIKSSDESLHARLFYSGTEFVITNNIAGNLRLQANGVTGYLHTDGAGVALSHLGIEQITTASDGLIAGQVLRLRAAGLGGSDLFSISSGTGGANIGNASGADTTAVVNIRAGDGSNVGIQITEFAAVLYGEQTPTLQTVRTTDRVASNSGAQVKDGTGSFKAVGYNLMPLDTVSVNKTLTAAAIGRMERVITSGITVTVDVGVTGQTVCLINVAAGPITIAKTAGVAAINWFTGSGLSSSTTPLTIEPGGACTMFWEGTTVVGVWGTGISR